MRNDCGHLNSREVPDRDHSITAGDIPVLLVNATPHLNGNFQEPGYCSLQNYAIVFFTYQGKRKKRIPKKTAESDAIRTAPNTQGAP